MEKRMVVAMALSLAVVLVYAEFFAPKPPPVEPVQPAGVEQQADPANGGAQAEPENGESDPPESDGPDAPTPAVEDVPEQDDLTTDAERISLTFTQIGGALKDARVWGNPVDDPRSVASPADPGHATLYRSRGPGALAVDIRGRKLFEKRWRLEARADGAVTADLTTEGLQIVRTVTPSTDPDAPFHSDVEIRIRNSGDAEAGTPLLLEVYGPQFHLTKGKEVDDGVVVVQLPDDVEVYQPRGIADDLAERRAEGGDLFEAYDQGWKWIGVRNDFFVGALEPREPLPTDAVVAFGLSSEDGAPEDERLGANASFRIPVRVPAAGESKTLGFRLFTGPNSAQLFETTPAYKSIEDAVPHRMLSFGPIESLLSWLLTTFADFGLGYGWAICLLTLMVRGALFPLSRKSQISMRLHANKMAVLQPKMDAIRKKYKDPQKQQQKIMQLMREEKASLVPGGCLIAFVQMPIWISLYGLLQTTFEMRYEGFLWFDDLTSADHLLELPFAAGWPIIDGWFNLLPILMMITWFVSSTMQPLPTDPQQAQTAKMMRFMPLLFGVMLYKFASGLALYMTLSALWSIGEVQLIRRVWLNKIPQVKREPKAE